MDADPGYGKGDQSAGVIWQNCSATGKIDNCQEGLPKSWIEDKRGTYFTNISLHFEPLRSMSGWDIKES
jgi:hypothetical protein